MAKTLKLFSYLIVLVALMMARGPSVSQARRRLLVLDTSKPISLVERLKTEVNEESPSCWESLMQIQSCGGEVILFFLNGETYLGDLCCHAIQTITHQCWPNMLETVLGYTTEEGDILQGYCDHETTAAADSPPSARATANSMIEWNN